MRARAEGVRETGGRTLDLVAAQRVVASVCQRRMRKPAVVAWVLIVVEDDLPVEVFEAGHRVLSPRPR